MKIIALILIIVVVASSGGAGFSYYVLRPASSLPKGQCSNSATNYPTCNTCVSGSTFTSGACYTNCSNRATNPPSCNQYPPCTNGTTNPPNCNEYPPCSNGGANPPTCTPPCTNGAANPPTCDEYPTRTSVYCGPSTVVANVTRSQCFAYVSSSLGMPNGTAVINCVNAAGLSNCAASPSQCPLGASDVPGASNCFFYLEAGGFSPSVTVNATYTGEQFTGSGGLLSSTGSVTLILIQPPAHVVVSGMATSLAVAGIVRGIIFTTGGHEYRATYATDNYNATLPNLRTYSVTIFYVTPLSRVQLSCNAGTLLLYSAYSTWNQNFQC